MEAEFLWLKLWAWETLDHTHIHNTRRHLLGAQQRGSSSLHDEQT